MLLIAVLLAVGAALFHRVSFAEIGRSPDWGESLFATYSLFAGEPVYAIPSDWPLRAVYFSFPLIGLVVVADTVVRVTLLLFSRQENQKEWNKVLASTYRDHIILCGLGRVGYRILERLMQWHLDVVVIEKDEQSQFVQRMKQSSVPLLFLDARQEETLTLAGLAHARTLVIATNDDLANVEVALDARRLNPKIRVVLRMFDENIATKLKDAFNLDVAFSSAAVAAPLVAASVLDIDILGNFTVEGRELFTARLRIEPDCALLGKDLGTLSAEREIVVLSRKPEGQAMHFSPPPDEQLAVGDLLVVHGELHVLQKLAKRAKSRSA